MRMLLAIMLYVAVELWHKDVGYFMMGLGNNLHADFLLEMGRWVVQTENRAYKKTIMFLVLLGIMLLMFFGINRFVKKHDPQKIA